MPDNTNSFINSIRRTNASNQVPVNDRGSLLAQSLTYSRAGSISRVNRNTTLPSNQSGISSSTNLGAGNLNTFGNTSVSNSMVLRLFDLNGDKKISNEELIDVSLKKHFSDSVIAAAVQYNPNAIEITNFVKQTDRDLNGEVSDVELSKELLADRRGELPALSADIKNYLFNKNSNRAAIETELNNYDHSSGTGSIADHLISDLEVLDRLTALKAAGTTITVATRAVLGTNPHYMKIQELVNNTDFTSIDSETEKFNFLLNARKYGIEKVFADNELPGSDATNAAILKLVQNLDKDADGIISQREFIAAYVAINKKGNPDQLDAGLFDTLIASQESFRSIPTFVNRMQINANGNIDEAQAATLIAQAKGSSATDNSLLLDIIKELTSNIEFKNLLGLLKPTAGMSPEELVSVLLASRSPAFSNIASTVLGNLIDVDSNGTGKTYNDAIIDIDLNENGIIDAGEVSRALLRNNSGATSYSEEVLTKILGTNVKYAEIKQVVDIFDTGTKDGVYSNEEILKGLLEIKKLKLTVSNSDLSLALNNNDLLQGLPNLVSLFDPGASGVISEEAYAKVMVNIAKGGQAEIDPNLLAIIETQVPSAAIIKNAIQAFVNDFNKDLTPQELMAKFKPLITTNNAIDKVKLATLSKVIGVIYPNADTLINVYLNFDRNHNDSFDDDEVVLGLLRYNSGQLGRLSNTALNSIISQAPHSEAIKYALSIIDTKGDGEISFAELIDTLMQINRGDFAKDTKFNKDIFDQILKTNTNYALADRVMSKFNYAPGFKPTTMDLAASVLVQNSLVPTRGVDNADRDEFLKMIGMFGKPELTQINAEITKLPSASFDSNGRLKSEILLDKSILLSLGKLSSSAALTALLRTNSEYVEMSRLFGKYSENKKLTENSLVKILVETTRLDPSLVAGSTAAIAAAAKNETIKNYFINLLSGDTADIYNDYKTNAAAPVSPAVLLTEDAFKNELLSITITGIEDPLVIAYQNAVQVLDSDHDGKITAGDFSLHQFLFSDQYNKATIVNIDYDFNKDGKVDAADKAIFDRVTNYLKINS